MPRTTTTAVKNVLGGNYDTVNAPPLTPFIDAANATASRAAGLADDAGFTLSVAEKELMERYLAAQNYCAQDALYSSRSTLSASGSFIRDTKIGDFAKIACSFDPSGSLMALLLGNTAGGVWAGKPLSEQLTFDERNT